MTSSLTRVKARSELTGIITIPPSKSYTHRSVVISSLARGDSVIRNPLRSRDTNATINGCKAFGAKFDEVDSLKVVGCSPLTPEDVVNVENSGTTLRFLSSVLTLTPSGFSVLTGDASIRRRPMQPLLNALTDLGAFAKSARGNGCAPVIIGGGGLKGGEVNIRGDISSQFISSLLISAPFAKNDIMLRTMDAVSRPYIDATIAVMQRFGVEVANDNYETFTVRSGGGYKSGTISVPGDFSSASFLAAAVAMVGGKVELRGLSTELPQGDSVFFDILRTMGVNVNRKGDVFIVESNADKLNASSFDLRDAPDLLPVIAVLGLKCDSKLVIRGVRHARFKETDRISVLTKELKKLGSKIRERPDGLEVEPSDLKPATLDAHDDHRMFMAFTVVSMLFPDGIPVQGAECLDVSYPEFLQHIGRLGAVVECE
jgi:3-phosphoshikimate 1-carboxyvinyltransferase